jgi:hypothetical protein
MEHRLREKCSAGCKRQGNGFPESCKNFNVPRSTLLDYVKSSDFEERSIIPPSPLVFGVDFIPEQNNRNEDYATPPKERNQTGLQMLSPSAGTRGKIYFDFSTFDTRTPPGLQGPSTTGRGGGKATVVTSSPYQKGLRQSLDKCKKEK